MSQLKALFHTAILLIALSAAFGASARTDVDARGQVWVAAVVSKITRVDERDGGVGSGSVSVRLRIEADGALAGIGIDESSGIAALDERAVRAVRAAAPFAPPPQKLLTLEGFIELSFPLQLGRPSAR